MSSRCYSEDEWLALASGAPGFDQEPMLAHLDGCHACGAALAESARALGAPDARAVTEEHEARTLPDGDLILGRYQIQRFIARGGMGEVYQALDLLLDEGIALKTLRCTAIDDARAVFRFKAEVRLARRVTHANVCRILEFGLHPRSVLGRQQVVPFLTMELLRGETLDRRIARTNGLATEKALPLIDQVAAGLAAIHAAGIVHRDLKSENVLLVDDGPDSERAVVMDFGLARALDGSIVSSWPNTAVLAGTIDRMAPEQIEGKKAGVPADVFAMGVLIFEVLTGRLPFVDVPPLKRLRQRAPLPSDLVPGLAAEWDQLVGRCLELDPKDRFASVRELKVALGATGAGRVDG
jgi:eukaryotic-like serine/threonine-protein kinase